MPLVTTLNKIRKHGPCESGWIKLLKHLNKTTADDEPLPFSVIVESNGFEDALWCCRSTPEYNKEWRLFAVKCARKVQHLMTDPRSIAALDVAERFANGEATDEELAIANAGAYAAAQVAANAAANAGACAAAQVAANAAAKATSNVSAYAAALIAAHVALHTSGRAAALVAAYTSGCAAANAGAAANDEANPAAYDAARKEQKQIFLEIVK